MEAITMSDNMNTFSVDEHVDTVTITFTDDNGFTARVILSRELATKLAIVLGTGVVAHE